MDRGATATAKIRMTKIRSKIRLMQKLTPRLTTRQMLLLQLKTRKLRKRKKRRRNEYK